MAHFQVTENIEEALKRAGGSRRASLGYCYHTFRIRLPDPKAEWQSVLSKLVDAGWQLQGAPLVVEAVDASPCHLLISMLHAEPHPLQIRGELRINGSFGGGAELRGEVVT